MAASDPHRRAQTKSSHGGYGRCFCYLLLCSQLSACLDDVVHVAPGKQRQSIVQCQSPRWSKSQAPQIPIC